MKLDKNILKQLSLPELKLTFLVKNWFEYAGANNLQFNDDCKPKSRIVKFLNNNKIGFYYSPLFQAILNRVF
tara:strand:+ start:295 stop:510 length:216 start_codon:yes stop_codon:yes gene_type:complete